MRVLLGFALVVFLGTPAWSAPAKKAAQKPAAAQKTADGKAPAAATYVQLKLQHALEDAISKLPNIEPWQRRIFNEEVMAQPQRFVRDYRASGSGQVSVDVDLEAVKSYLRFNAPKSLKRDPAPFLVALRAEEGCAKCQESDGSLRKMVIDRLERRSMSPVWAVPADVPLELDGRALEEKIAAVAGEKKTAGYLIVRWQKAPQDDVDSAHADELRFIVHTVLMVNGVSRQEGQLEIFDTGSFEKTAAQLLTDAFAELGTKLDRAVLAGDASGRTEREGIPVDVTGIRDYAQYASLRAQLQEGPFSKSGLYQVEEQKISRGHVVFAVYTDKPASELRRALSGIAFGSDRGRVRLVIGAADSGGDALPILMEVR